MFFFPITPKARNRYRLARSLYAACIVQSRRPEFYAELAIPDTFDGRFELTSLHAGMVVSELSLERGEKNKMAQALFDEMFVNLEQVCREMGIGDLSVPRHVKRMMKAFKGRSLAYRDALAGGDMKGALLRNLYGTSVAPDDTVVTAMADYVASLAESLKNQDLMNGSVTFPVIPVSGDNQNGTASKAA